MWCEPPKAKPLRVNNLVRFSVSASMILHILILIQTSTICTMLSALKGFCFLFFFLLLLMRSELCHFQGLLCSKTLVFFRYLGTELEQIILSDVCGLPGATYRCVSTKISQITRRINATIYYRLQSFLEAKDKLRRICVSSLSCTHWLTHQSPGKFFCLY